MKKTHSRLTLEDIAKEIHISRTTIYKPDRLFWMH